VTRYAVFDIENGIVSNVHPVHQNFVLATMDNNPWHHLIMGLVLLAASPLVLKFYPKIGQNIGDLNGTKGHPAYNRFSSICGSIFVGLSGLFLVISAVIRFS